MFHISSMCLLSPLGKHFVLKPLLRARSLFATALGQRARLPLMAGWEEPHFEEFRFANGRPLVAWDSI